MAQQSSPGPLTRDLDCDGCSLGWVHSKECDSLCVRMQWRRGVDADTRRRCAFISESHFVTREESARARARAAVPRRGSPGPLALGSCRAAGAAPPLHGALWSTHRVCIWPPYPSRLSCGRVGVHIAPVWLSPRYNLLYNLSVCTATSASRGSPQAAQAHIYGRATTVPLAK